MSSIMRRRNGLFASSVMGMLLSWWRLRTPHLKTGRPVALSSWLYRQPRRPTARAVSFIGPIPDSCSSKKDRYSTRRACSSCVSISALGSYLAGEGLGHDLAVPHDECVRAYLVQVVSS